MTLRYKKIVYALWGLLFVAVLLVAAAFALIGAGKIGYVPRIDQLQRPISIYATQILSSDGKLLGTWSQQKNRIFVDYNQISPYLIEALVSTEDERFYSHSGIDARALLRAIVKRGLLGHRNAGGGSTITQQLAKQLYSGKAESTLGRLVQKPIEWVIAVKLERYYTKEEILTLYLNYFDFLHQAVGIKMAADIYFGKQPAQLSLAQSATLVGMCKNPAYFNPVREPERALERRNVVLHQMLKAGCIDEERYEAACREPLGLNFHRVDHKDGPAAYLREHLRGVLMAEKPQPMGYASWQRQRYYEDSLAWADDPLYGWCNKHTKSDGSHYNIYTDGLKVYTTIDYTMQRYAEEVVRGHVEGYLQRKFEQERRSKPTFPFTKQLTRAQVEQIVRQAMRSSDRYRTLKADGYSDDEIYKSFSRPEKMTVYTSHGEKDTTMTPRDSILYYKSFLRSGFMVMDPLTGHVKAYVGGLDYTHFQYDMCSDGRRQVGSTIKPFLYALAMENGYTPCDEAPNVRQTYMVAGKPWSPANASHARYGEMVTLKWGLSQSNNWISAYLMSHLNPRALVSLIHQFGVQNLDIYPSMALCLGPCDISVSEMCSAYTAFAGGGIRSAPLFVTRIEDSKGNVLAEFQPRMNEVIGAESAYRMLDMLQAVIDHGTGGRIRYKYHLTAPMAGKTGTTNNQSDGWFIGIVPRLVGACWVGGENRDIHFDSMTYGQGASMALPIWAYFLKKVYRNKSLGYSENERFEYPTDFNPCAAAPADSLDATDIDEIFE